MDYTISSGYRTDQRLIRQGAICSVCQMHYTFVIKLETFDQDMRELCHQLNVENKETCDGFLIYNNLILSNVTRQMDTCGTLIDVYTQ